MKGIIFMKEQWCKECLHDGDLQVPILSYLLAKWLCSSSVATMDSGPFTLISARKLALIMAQACSTYGLLDHERRLGPSHMPWLKQTSSSCLVLNDCQWSPLLSVLWPSFNLGSLIPAHKVDHILSRTTDI
jgi:hypothetical protein